MRIVIAEDLTLLREGLTRLLRDRGWEIVAAVDNGPALLPALPRTPSGKIQKFVLRDREWGDRETRIN